MPPVGFETTVSLGERPQIYVLDPGVSGTNIQNIHPIKMKLILENIRITDTNQLESK